LTFKRENSVDEDNDIYALRSTYYQGSLMVNLCDIELVGKKLNHNGVAINITKEYWQERLVRSEEAEDMLKKCSIANLAGKSIVDKAIRIRLANPKSVKQFSGVPFLMLFRFTQTYNTNNK
jgi:hypothetical protein